jgi:FMNH2-dependent dimethyl sulfone monooxygenase
MPIAGLPGNNKFKLGLFRMNCAGGLAITRAPERWQAQWDDIVAAAQTADLAGFELILPLARWRGYGGEIDTQPGRSRP